MLITRTSALTGIERTLDIPVTKSQLEAWHKDVHIQTATPNLTPAQREFIKTGITSEEWDNAFPKEEEGGNDDENDSDEEYLSAMYDLNGNPR